MRLNESSLWNNEAQRQTIISAFSLFKVLMTGTWCYRHRHLYCVVYIILSCRVITLVWVIGSVLCCSSKWLPCWNNFFTNDTNSAIRRVVMFQLNRQCFFFCGLIIYTSSYSLTVNFSLALPVYRESSQGGLHQQECPSGLQASVKYKIVLTRRMESLSSSSSLTLSSLNC